MKPFIVKPLRQNAYTNYLSIFQAYKNQLPYSLKKEEEEERSLCSILIKSDRIKSMLLCSKVFKRLVL